MIFIATGFIPLTAVHWLDNGYVQKQPVARKELCAESLLKELRESMGRCTGRHDITEILLKSIIQFSLVQTFVVGTELTHSHTMTLFDVSGKEAF